MHISQKFCRSILDWSLFVCNLDPFELFKDEETRERLRFRLGQSSEFHLNYNQQDTMRSKLARLNRLFASYYLVKMYLIGFVHHCLLEHEFRRQLSREPLIGLDLLFKLRSLLGNPLGLLVGSALYFYQGWAGLVFIGIVLVPRYYKRKKQKLDMTHLRFMLRPHLERARMNSTIELSCKS